MISSANPSPLAVNATALTAASSPKASAVTDQGGSAPTPAEQKRQIAEALKRQQFQNALTTLKNLHDFTKATAASIAQQKLEALKQRLKMLMMLGGDPKQIAREAAQIAKEIGETAKAYAAAAGNSSSAGAPAAVPVGADADTKAPVADAAAGQGAADAGASATDAENTADKLAAGAGPGDPAKRSDGKSATGPTADPTSPKPRSETSGTPPHPAGPDSVIEEAKQLAAKTKAILKAAIARAKLQHADPTELLKDQDEVSAAEKDIHDAEKALGAGAGAPSYSAEGQAAATSAAPQPTVSIQA